MRARSGPLAVEIRTALFAGMRGQRSVITVGGLADLSLETDGFPGTAAHRLERGEIEVGDPPFDHALFVRGPEPVVRAVFGTETRRLVRLLLEGRVELSDGEQSRALGSAFSVRSGVLRLEAVDVIGYPHWLGECLPGLLAVARRLVRPGDVPGHLATNAREDPLPRVRAANLRALIVEYSGWPATRQALRSALDDPSLEVAALAALELLEHVEGAEERVRRAASDAGLPERLQARAVVALRRRLPVESLSEILRDAVETRRLKVAEACLAVLGENGGPEAIDVMTEVLAVEWGPLAVTAVRALGRSGGADVESALLAVLGRNRADVVTAAARVLGRVGSAAAVGALRRVESSSGDEGARRAAREAIAQIQERLTGASPGQLSLADGESGQLSLTEDERGRVAIHDDEESPVEGGRRR
jgi:hypothetical protein